MAVVICCPCGNPIDSEHLDLVVSLTCPNCRREIDIEIDAGPIERRKAILTVMEGPHWVGERFIVPVGVDLQIGQRAGNWISLEDENVADVHCRLRLHQDGNLFVEDQPGSTGTFIGTQRIAKAKLAPKQSLRIGSFRLRLDYLSAEGTTITSQPVAAPVDPSGILPTMTQVGSAKTLGSSFVSQRFRAARILMMFGAWLMAAYHCLATHNAETIRWRWPVAVAFGLTLGTILTAASRRVTLAHHYFKFSPLLLLICMAITDLIWSLPIPAISSLALAAGISALVVSVPRPGVAIAGAIASALSAVALAIGIMLQLIGR